MEPIAPAPRIANSNLGMRAATPICRTTREYYVVTAIHRSDLGVRVVRTLHLPSLGRERPYPDPTGQHGGCHAVPKDIPLDTSRQRGALIHAPIDADDEPQRGNEQSTACARTAQAMQKACLFDVGATLPQVLQRGLELVRVGGNGPRARLICGFIVCDPQLCQTFLGGLPPIITVNIRDDPSGQWLENSLQFSVTEAARAQAGSTAVVAKLWPRLEAS